MEFVTTHKGDRCTVLAQADKNRSEVIRATVSSFEGRILFDLRTWFYGDDDALRPGRRGLAVQARQVPALLAVLREAADALGIEAIDDGEEWEEQARRALPNRYDRPTR
jgi:hypothetical protein